MRSWLPQDTIMRKNEMEKRNIAIKLVKIIFMKLLTLIIVSFFIVSSLSGCSFLSKKDSKSSNVTQTQTKEDNNSKSKSTKKEKSSKTSKNKKNNEQPKGIFGIIINVPKEFINNINAVFTEEKYKLPFLITLIVLVIKFVANHAVVALDFYKAFAEMPCEISILSMGFKTTQLLSSSKTANMDYFQELLSLLFVFIIIACFARTLIKAIDENGFGFKHWLFGILTYIMALWSFSVSITAVIK